MKRPVVLLFFPRTLHENNYRHYHVPYSLVSLATTVKEADMDLIIFDANAEGRTISDDELSHWGQDLFLVGISSMIGGQIHDALELSKRIKKMFPKVPVVWGGSLPTLLPEIVAKEEAVDIAVLGQGEITLKEILICLLNNTYPFDIKGTAYQNGHGEVIINDRRDFVQIDDVSSYKDGYDLINIPSYIWNDEHIAERTISYHSSQGCPYDCGFCAEVPLWMRKWSGLSARRIVEDIGFLATNYKINGIKFYDSEFFVNKKRVNQFARMLIDESIDIQWGASAHPRVLTNYGYRLMELLRSSGLKRLLIGLESGIESEREFVGKRISDKEIFDLAKICSDLEIHVCFTFVTGYPGFPSDNIIKTLDFGHRLFDKFKNHEVKIHFYGPYPKTPLYEKALQHGFHPPQSLKDWANYDYYKIMTPWVPESYFELVRKFNEEHYPYLDGNTLP